MIQPSNKEEGVRPSSTTTGKPSPTNPTKTALTESKPEVKARKRMPPWIRIPLRILRILLVPMLSVFALIAGVVIGYVYVGGRDSTEVWNLDTWKHLFELVFAN